VGSPGIGGQDDPRRPPRRGPATTSRYAGLRHQDPRAYPINLATYEIVCSKYKDAAKGKLVKSFLTHFVSADVQKSLEALGYAALPSSVSAKITAAVAAIG
jgi:ABC-type phosphate transport system substrate-binding protein